MNAHCSMSCTTTQSNIKDWTRSTGMRPTVSRWDKECSSSHIAQSWALQHDQYWRVSMKYRYATINRSGKDCSWMPVVQSCALQYNWIHNNWTKFAQWFYSRNWYFLIQIIKYFTSILYFHFSFVSWQNMRDCSTM